MKPIWIIVFLVFLIVAGMGVISLYKAYKLRGEVQTWQKYNKGLVDKLNRLSEDYPGINIYKNQNVELLQPTSPAQRKEMTVLLGASITKNWNLDEYFPGSKLINRGIGSQSGMQLLARFSSDVLQLDPGAVVIKFCSGNFKPGLDQQLLWDEMEMMACMAKSRGIKPILCTVIPVTREAEVYEGYNISRNILEFNDKIKDYAQKHNLKVVDYYSAMADAEGFLPEDMGKDPIHPNEKGYQVMASVLNDIL